MNDWQIGVMFLAAMFGSVFSGLLGYAQAKKADPTVTFKWFDLVLTFGAGFVAGGGYILATDLSETVFGAASIITGLFVGGGFTYAVKKTVLNP